MSKRSLVSIVGLLVLGACAVAQVPDTTQRSTVPKEAIEAMPPLGSMEALRQYEDLSGGPLQAASRVHAVLSLDATGMYDSNALRNDLVMGIWAGETLSRELREATQADLKGNNRAGSEASVRLGYAWGRSLFGRNDLRPVIGIAYHDVLGMRFTDAVYDLTFFGNAQFEGEAAVIAPTEVEQQRYQTIGFGMERTDRRTFLRLDLVNGQYLNSVKLERGYLYTAVDGRSLDADVDGTWLTSDTAGQSFGRTNGLGLAMSGGLELRSNTMSYTLRLEDLGFIAWNGNSQRLEKDELIHYDGLYVDDIIDLSGSLVGETQLRDTLGLYTTAGSFLRPLPARFQVGASRSHRHGKTKARRRPEEFLLEQLALPGYIPHLTWTPSFALSRDWLCFGKVGYGGFGGLRVGIGAWGTTDWGLVKVEVPNLVGTISPSAKGKAVMIGLELAF